MVQKRRKIYQYLSVYSLYGIFSSSLSWGNENKWPFRLVRSHTGLLKCGLLKFRYFSAPWTHRYNLLFTPFPKPRPSSERRPVICWIWVRCRHRSERPFISALGRWTPHLISNKGNFSILQPVFSDTATNLGFYYFSSPASFSPAIKKKNPPHSNWTLLCIFPCELFFCAERVRETAARSFAFQQRGLWVFVRFFGSVEFLCWSGKHGSAIVQDSRKSRNRGW